MITRPDIAAHLEQNVRTGFLIGSRAAVPLRQAFVRETPSDGAFETYADLGTAPWPLLNSGAQGDGGTDTRTGASVVNRLNAGRAVTVIGGQERALIVYNLDWEIVTAVTHNAINDDRAGDLESWARGAAINFDRHKDKEAFSALNDGASAATYGNDYTNSAFFGNSKVDPGAEYTTGQDNLNALTLNLDNFETVKVAGAKFRDDRGEPVGFNHNLLVVPSDLERIAAQISGNREAYDTANREINPYEGSVSHLVAPGAWLDSTAWFLLDVSQQDKPIMLQNRQNPDLVIWDDESQGDGGHRYFKWHARYAVFYGNWRLALMGNT